MADASPKSARALIKLKKSPLELVISSDPMSQQQQQQQLQQCRPIGTPPPTSVRNSRFVLGTTVDSPHQHLGGLSSASGSALYPQISVDKCPEADEQADAEEENQFAFPPPPPPPSSSSSPPSLVEDTDGDTSTDNDKETVEALGLIPPQRLLRRASRDSEVSGDIVFELSTAQMASVHQELAEEGQAEAAKSI